MTVESQAAEITDALPAGQRSGVRQPSEQMDTTCMYDLIAQNEKPGGEAGLRHMPVTEERLCLNIEAR